MTQSCLGPLISFHKEVPNQNGTTYLGSSMLGIVNNMPGHILFPAPNGM